MLVSSQSRELHPVLKVLALFGLKDRSGQPRVISGMMAAPEVNHQTFLRRSKVVLFL